MNFGRIASARRRTRASRSGSALASRGELPGEHLAAHTQPHCGPRPLDQLLHQLDAPEDHALAGPRHVAEHPVLDWVVLRAVRGEVGDPDLQTRRVGQPAQVLLEQPRVGGVAPTAVAEHQQATSLGIRRLALRIPPPPQALHRELGGVPAEAQVNVAGVAGHIEDPVRDDLPVAVAGEVVVEGLHRARGVELPVAVEVADQLLLFGSSGN